MMITFVALVGSSLFASLKVETEAFQPIIIPTIINNNPSLKLQSIPYSLHIHESNNRLWRKKFNVLRYINHETFSSSRRLRRSTTVRPTSIPTALNNKSNSFNEEEPLKGESTYKNLTNQEELKGKASYENFVNGKSSSDQNSFRKKPTNNNNNNNNNKQTRSTKNDARKKVPYQQLLNRNEFKGKASYEDLMNGDVIKKQPRYNTPLQQQEAVSNENSPYSPSPYQRLQQQQQSSQQPFRQEQMVEPEIPYPNSPYTPQPPFQQPQQPQQPPPPFQRVQVQTSSKNLINRKGLKGKSSYQPPYQEAIIVNANTDTAQDDETNKKGMETVDNVTMKSQSRTDGVNWDGGDKDSRDSRVSRVSSSSFQKSVVPNKNEDDNLKAKIEGDGRNDKVIQPNMSYREPIEPIVPQEKEAPPNKEENVQEVPKQDVSNVLPQEPRRPQKSSISQEGDVGQANTNTISAKGKSSEEPVKLQEKEAPISSTEKSEHDRQDAVNINESNEASTKEPVKAVNEETHTVAALDKDDQPSVKVNGAKEEPILPDEIEDPEKAPKANEEENIASFYEKLANKAEEEDSIQVEYPNEEDKMLPINTAKKNIQSENRNDGDDKILPVNDDDLKGSTSKGRKRRIELSWCGREYCHNDPIREKVIGDHNEIAFDSSATGQVMYTWVVDNDEEDDTSSSPRKSDDPNMNRKRFQRKLDLPSVLILVKKNDDELLKSASDAVRDLTSAGDIRVMLPPDTAAKFKHYFGVDNKFLELFDPEQSSSEVRGNHLSFENSRLDESMEEEEEHLRNDDSPDLVCTYGGDGLLMHASTLFPGPCPPILCVAGGSLGFLTPFNQDEMVHAIRTALGLPTGDDGYYYDGQGQASIWQQDLTQEDDPSNSLIWSENTNVNQWQAEGWRDARRPQKLKFGANNHICLSMRMRLDCRVINREGVVRARFNVLNEVVVDRGSSPYLAALECFCDDVHLTTVQADGVIFSTPTGSTAYSMAAGGSVVHPAVPSILVTPICPHVLSFRSMVLPDHVVLRCYVPEDARSEASIAFDGKYRRELHRGDSVQVQMSSYPVPTINRIDHSSDWLSSLKRNFNFNARARQGPL